MEELTPITRREVFLAKASGQEVETPTPVTREEVFLDAIANGGGGGEKFIVTLTPSDETFTFGEMDKTVGEIKQAVDAGMEVWFQITFNENLTGLYLCNGIDHYPNSTFEYVFVAMFVIDFGSFFLARLTTSPNSEDSTTWVSTIFPLTPAS